MRLVWAPARPPIQSCSTNSRSRRPHTSQQHTAQISPETRMLRWLGVGAVALLAAALGVGSKYAKRELPLFPIGLQGKTIIVTGASAGVGKESARLFAQWGANVIMAVRNPEKGEAVKENMVWTTKSTKIEVWKLDLADLSSVQKFAQRFLDSGKPLHVLMNNAGLVSWEHTTTKDGHELTYQTNHLGHFLLTKLLMPRLQESAPARVVQVSSEAHYMGDVLLDDLDWDTSKGRKYNAMKQYANTKLMNVLFANELTRRYKDVGVFSTSVHPGFVATDFLRDVPKWLDPVKKAVLDLFARDEAQGAYTQVWAATHPELEGVGGIYLDACVEREPNAKATNQTLAELLWMESERQVAAFVLPEAAEPVSA